MAPLVLEGSGDRPTTQNNYAWLLMHLHMHILQTVMLAWYENAIQIQPCKGKSFSLPFPRRILGGYKEFQDLSIKFQEQNRFCLMRLAFPFNITSCPASGSGLDQVGQKCILRFWVSNMDSFQSLNETNFGCNLVFVLHFFPFKTIAFELCV